MQTKLGVRGLSFRALLMDHTRPPRKDLRHHHDTRRASACSIGPTDRGWSASLRGATFIATIAGFREGFYYADSLPSPSWKTRCRAPQRQTHVAMIRSKSPPTTGMNHGQWCSVGRRGTTATSSSCQDLGALQQERNVKWHDWRMK